MQVKVEIKTTLSFHHKDVDPIEGASPEQVLQTARMQGAEIHMKVEPQRRPPAPKKAAQAVKEPKQPAEQGGGGLGQAPPTPLTEE